MVRFDQLVHRIVQDVALRDAHSVAVSFDGKTITYGCLAQRVNALAARLSQRGVGPGATVGICLNRSIDAIVAILAAMTSGATYTILDPGYPDDRLRFVIDDTGMRVVVTSTEFVPRLARTGVATIQMDALTSGLATSAPPSVTPEPDDLAYVIYTSGSTGKPKGVTVTHRNLAHSTAARFEYYRDPVAAYLLLSPLTFDSSVAGLFWTLCSGGRLVLPAPGDERDPTKLASLIERERISHLLALPSLYRLILERRGPASFSALRTVIVAGEACPVDLVAEHRRALPAVGFFNEYGPTEATVWCTVYEATGDVTGARVPIGRPIPRMRCHIVGGDGRLALPGESGELYVGGPGVTPGYLKRPDLTAERFVPNTFDVGDGGRLYRTGDLVRLLPDGAIEFLGRIDHQVKIRGHRIELGEIEAALREHPGVKDAVVLARPQSSGDLKLAAYVVPSADPTPTASHLNEFLAARLPDFMLPAAFVILTTLPLTTHGKVDREALPLPGRARPNLHHASIAPRTPLERWLARTWAEILDLDDVGINDPFSELGGRSLDAARFINRLQDTLNEFVFIVLVFECPTVATLAARLHRDYAQAVARVFGETPSAAEATSSAEHRVDDAMLARAATLVSTRPRTKPQQAPRNPQAVFLLAPPRSGTTLLTAMLAGHPRLFAASELNLLGFDTLGERRQVYQGKSSVFLDGALRSVMEIFGVTADDAIERLSRTEASDLSVRDFYRELQRAIAPRLLLDKSPAYGLDPAALARAEEDFEQPLYVHLSRHPYTAVRSFADHHMDQVYFPHEGFTSRLAGELVWSMTHRNVLAFLRGVPASRQTHVRYEDLVAQPERTMRSLSAALGLWFDPALLQPYVDKDRKVPPGVRPDSKPMGDPTFHTFGRITTERTQITPEDRGAAWGAPTVAVAAELGYDIRQMESRPPVDEARHTRGAADAQQIRGRLDQRRRLRRSHVASAI